MTKANNKERGAQPGEAEGGVGAARRQRGAAALSAPWSTPADSAESLVRKFLSSGEMKC